MSCKLKDYYKEGVPLDKSYKIILGLLDKEKATVKDVLRDFSTLNLIARNLESLGFLKYTHPPAAPEVTRKGGTLVLSQRSYIYSRLKRQTVPNEMGRFVLLKSVRDADWECFKEFYVANFNVPKSLTTKKAIKEYIRRNYYPQFTPGNMNHWYGLHSSLIRWTNADKALNGQRPDERFFNSLDPYREDFKTERFFARTLDQPTLSELSGIVDEALSIYKDELLGSYSVGHCETLKTVIQILLLDASLFEDELRLSEKVIRILKDQNIGLFRSNYPVLTDGRGLIDRRGNVQMSFKLFSL
jgi:hypothetical protein